MDRALRPNLLGILSSLGARAFFHAATATAAAAAVARGFERWRRTRPPTLGSVAPEADIVLGDTRPGCRVARGGGTRVGVRAAKRDNDPIRLEAV